MKILHNILFTSIFFISSTASVFAATYYVDANAADNSGSGAISSPLKYISSGISKMSPAGGDTLIIKNGTYSNSLDDMVSFVSGTTNNYNVIKAETDGGVTITKAFSIKNDTHHVQIEGVKFSSNLVKNMYGAHHIKILRSAFEGGPLSGNKYTFSIGSSSSVTEYILIEDSWFYGPGGRQNLAIYKANKVVIRRVVLRHDLGWSNVLKPDPEGVGTIYNSNNVELQNVIVIDSNRNSSNVGSEWVGAFTVVNNTDSGGTCRDNNITGSILLNVFGNGFAFDGNGEVQNIQIKDSVVWWSDSGDSRGGGVTMNNPGQKTVTATNVTLGNLDFGVGLWNGTNSNITINNSIVYGMNYPIGTPSNGTITNSYNNCSNNSNNSLCTKGTGIVTFDATTNGLSHIPRIENGTTLITSGQAGTRMGANITNKMGVSGTLWGETGYNSLTDEALWPWPNEARLYDDMNSVSNRGFAAPGQTLTNYIWSAIGNAPPSDIASVVILAPKNIRITKKTP